MRSNGLPELAHRTFIRAMAALLAAFMVLSIVYALNEYRAMSSQSSVSRAVSGVIVAWEVMVLINCIGVYRLKEWARRWLLQLLWLFNIPLAMICVVGLYLWCAGSPLDDLFWIINGSIAGVLLWLVRQMRQQLKSPKTQELFDPERVTSRVEEVMR